MFAKEKAPLPGPNGTEDWIIDHSRKAWLQIVGYAIGEPAVGFCLQWRHRVMPLEVEVRTHKDESGQEYLRGEFISFGSSTITLRYGFRSWTFESEEDREQARLVAIEALIFYYNSRGKAPRPDGRFQFLHGGRIYTKADFGYP